MFVFRAVTLGHCGCQLLVTPQLFTNPTLDFVARATDKDGGECESSPQANLFRKYKYQFLVFPQAALMTAYPGTHQVWE